MTDDPAADYGLLLDELCALRDELSQLREQLSEALIEGVSALALGPEDLLVLRYEGRLPDTSIERIRSQVSSAIQIESHRVLVLGEGMRLQVLRRTRTDTDQQRADAGARNAADESKALASRAPSASPPPPYPYPPQLERPFRG